MHSIRPRKASMEYRPPIQRRQAVGVVATVLLLALPAGAQQFVQETTTRFPSPNPSDFTNQLTIGDIDGDGDQDLIFANGGNFSTPGPNELVRVFVNDGSGFFTDNSAAAMSGFNGLHRGVELGDVDLDGDLDMILVQDFNRQPSLHINNGSGVFADETGSRLPAMTLSSTRAQFGDIDNDGDLDIYINNGGATSRFGCGQSRVWINDGNGFYTDETVGRHPIGNVCEPMDVIFGDIDGDFDIDVRTGNRDANASKLYRNDGTGVFTEVGGVPADNNTYSYDFGDIDGDGDLDLLGANSNFGSGGELLLINDGSGGYTNGTSQILTNPSIDDNDTKFLDYDNDGDLDFVIAALGGSSERIYNNDGTGVFTLTAGVISLQVDSSLDVMVADLTGDGAVDIVTAQGESGASFQNRIYVNNGPADTLPPTIWQTETQGDTLDFVGPYVIRASITDHHTSDRNFFHNGIFLNYSVDAGPVQQVSMMYSGGQIYRGEIPGQSGGSQIEYWVTATDFNDNTATGPTQSFGVFGGPGCCLPDGTCADLNETDCMAMDGVTPDAGEVCGETGACCVDIDDGPFLFETCEQRTEACCNVAGGVFHGVGNSCELRACCLPSGLCQELDRLCCIESGGTAGENGSVCLDDSNGDGLDDYCCPPTAMPQPEDSFAMSCAIDDDCGNMGVCVEGRCYAPKNRYLSIAPNNGAEPVALRVTMTASELYPAEVGSSWWVQSHEPGDTSGVYRLGCTPVFQDWGLEPAVIHVADTQVTTQAQYDVQAIHLNCDGGTEASFSVAVSLPTSPVWGDVVGGLEGGTWLPGNGIANLEDALVTILAIEGEPGTPDLSWLDLEGAIPNGLVNLADALNIVLAVEGATYPFDAPETCP